MYNQVYLNLNENVDEEETLLLLKDLYPNQVVEKTKDINQIKRIAQQYSISIQLIMVLSFLPLTFTLFLLARINFKKNEKEMLILKILGTTKAKTFYFFFAEYVLYIIIGFLISLPIWYFLIKMMVTYLGDEALFLMTHPVKYIFVSFILVFVYISLFFLVFFHKLQRVNFCEASRQLNTKYEFTSLRHNKMIIPIITIFLFFIWMLLEYIIFPNMGVSIGNHLLKAIAGFMVTSLLSLFMLRLLLQLMSLLFINKSRFVIIEIKEIIAQKLTFWLLSMAIFSIVTITVALHSYNQMEINANRTKEHLGFNLFITNITIKQDKYDSLLSSYSEIESYAKGFLYSKVHLPQYNHDLPLVLSVEPSKLTEFINYELEEEVLLQMQDQQKLSIILSHKYQKVYGLSIGDTIDLQINANQEVTKYLVAGFIPEEYDIYAFTNMYNNSESTSIHPFNAIFIKGYDENYLVNDLSKRIVADGAQVIKLENFFIELTRFIYNNQKFLFLFIVIVTICFVLVLVALFGFVFMEKKKQLTLLRALGDNPSLLTVIGKTMIVSAILMFISYLAIKLISPSIVSMVRVSEVDFSIVGIEKEFILVDIFISFLFGLMYLWEWTKKVMDQSILSH
jgi:ABC-type lipoprotein release transport system permease subunit